MADEKKSADDKKEEALTAPRPLEVDGQEQPITLPDVMAQEGTEGAKPEAREKAADKKSTHGKVTALHQVIHDGKEHGPGAELSGLSELDVRALLEAGMVVEAVGKDAEAALERAHTARAVSLPGAGVVDLPTAPGVEFTDKEVDSKDQTKLKGARS